ncbi:MAG: hypothetical protein SVV03_03415 [Candidatus Nanohaloarchaea archaeon]|nr:hypothetical protein [Candidatus Nanohaloarchaea archaeon]
MTESSSNYLEPVEGIIYGIFLAFSPFLTGGVATADDYDSQIPKAYRGRPGNEVEREEVEEEKILENVESPKEIMEDSLNHFYRNKDGLELSDINVEGIEYKESAESPSSKIQGPNYLSNSEIAPEKGSSFPLPGVEYSLEDSDRHRKMMKDLRGRDINLKSPLLPKDITGYIEDTAEGVIEVKDKFGRDIEGRSGSSNGVLDSVKKAAETVKYFKNLEGIDREVEETLGGKFDAEVDLDGFKPEFRAKWTKEQYEIELEAEKDRVNVSIGIDF